MKWRIHKQDKERVAELARALNVSPVVAWVLLNRGIEEGEAGRAFLHPELGGLEPREPMADMDKAVARIALALERKETIGVHGDYDVDGITGAALLIRFFRALGASVVWHIPHRQREGYGMKPLGVDALADQGASLIVTVDCGVSDREAIVRANELKIDVVVVDHHQVPDELPPAIAILNHNRPDCPFQGEDISGVGTAFYLAAGVRAHLRETGKLKDNGPHLGELLDLVALGTVADVVPMTGKNRLLVHFGLKELNAGRRPGLIQLRRVAGILDRPVGVGQLAFQLAPRLNAAGRLDSGEPSLKLLLADDEKEAGLLAEELEKMNRTRRDVEGRIMAEAMAQIESSPGMESAPAIVAFGQGWHIGVIGIVAGRITENFFRPSAVIGVHQGMGKGSLRSVPGINIFKALCRLSHLLETFGGHPQAAGISIKEQNIPAFVTALIEAVAAESPDHNFEPALNLDAEWPIARCDRRLIDDLACLKPHGIGNPEPVFCARGVLVKWAREARNNTLMMGVQENNLTLPAVGFRLGHRIPEPGNRLDLAYTPILDSYQGQESLKLRVKDFQVIG
ncbi:MAG TPA: single-stranded-DNA-specific exonuclease RecJ [bacterium]|nr:single-stranded-DNA-specific exonuclease RecJ [bacterium]